MIIQRPLQILPLVFLKRVNNSWLLSMNSSHRSAFDEQFQRRDEALHRHDRLALDGIGFFGYSQSDSNTKGDPPALPGRQSKFDISGGRPRLSIGETPEGQAPKHSHRSKMTAVPPAYAASRVVGLVQRRSTIDLRCSYEQIAAIRWWASPGTQVFRIVDRAR
jgi:hypothetical protein